MTMKVVVEGFNGFFFNSYQHILNRPWPFGPFEKEALMLPKSRCLGDPPPTYTHTHTHCTRARGLREAAPIYWMASFLSLG